MTPVTRVKLGLAIAGLIAFGIGVYLDRPGIYNWVAIALLAAAFSLRFVERGKRRG